MQDSLTPSSSSITESSRLKQQTLTQFGLVQDTPADVELSSDSEAEQYEHVHQKDTERREIQETQDDDSDEDVVPTSRQKRRRTLGGSSTSAANKIRRRTTSGGSPPASSKYHTQTLTQFVSQKSMIADSDDDGGLSDGGEEFLSWLGNDSKQQERNEMPQAEDYDNEGEEEEEDLVPASPREESVVPQTPVKATQTPVKTLRFQLPPTQETSPSKSVADSQSPSRPLASTPLAKKKKKTMIQDSYATDSWSSPTRAETPKFNMTQSQADDLTTPMVASPSPEIRRKIPKALMASSSQTNDLQSSAVRPRTKDVCEIPDSDDDEDSWSQSEEVDETIIHDTRQNGEEDNQTTVQIREQDSETMQQSEATPELAQLTTTPLDETHEAKEADDAQPQIAPESTRPVSTQATTQGDTFATGAETQLVLDQLACTSQWQKPQASQAPSATPFSSAREHQTPPPLLRKPTTHATQHGTQGLPLESQRVAISILHTFAPTSPRSDILIPVDTASFNALIQGYSVTLRFPFKVPAQVVRLWLFHDSTLRYLAVLSSERPSSPAQEYAVEQVYELNNPMSEDDMRAEEWLYGKIDRYTYFPPAVVSQLLYNLRHAVFQEGSDQGNLIPSSAPKQHQHEDVIPSTPDEGESEDLTLPTATQAPFPSSQASTASHESSFNALTCPEPLQSSAPMPSSAQQAASSDSVAFISHSYSSYAAPFSMMDASIPLDGSFQLLSKSQILPDSVLRDDPNVPKEVWDSNDSGEE